MRTGDRIYQDYRRFGVVLAMANGRALVRWLPVPKATEWVDIEASIRSTDDEGR